MDLLESVVLNLPSSAGLGNLLSCWRKSQNHSPEKSQQLNNLQNFQVSGSLSSAHPMLRIPDGNNGRPNGLILHVSYCRKAHSPHYMRSSYRIPWNIYSFPSACFLRSTEANVIKPLPEIAKSEGGFFGGFYFTFSPSESQRPFKSFSLPVNSPSSIP